jgi:predicted nucleic acid-binding protein
VSLLDATRMQHARMHGHRQLTDLYLLALAVHHGGRFVTFDAQIPLSAVRGATRDHLVSL